MTLINYNCILVLKKTPEDGRIISRNMFVNINEFTSVKLKCNFCSLIHFMSVIIPVYRSSTVVKVLCYKSEGRWFDPSSSLKFFIDIKSFRPHYGPGVDSASNRNEYQEYFLGVKEAGL